MQNSNQGSNGDKGITHNNQVYLIHNYYAPCAGNPNGIRIIREDEIVKKINSDSVSKNIIEINPLPAEKIANASEEIKNEDQIPVANNSQRNQSDH